MMKASEIIAELNDLINQYGDLETFCAGDEIIEVKLFRVPINLNDALETELRSFFVFS